MNWSDLLLLATGTAATVGALYGTYRTALRVYDDVDLRKKRDRTFNAKLDAFRQRSAAKALRHLPADENGRLGTVLRPDGTALLLDTHALFNQDWQIARLDERLEQLAHVERLMLSSPAHGGEIVQQIGQGEDAVPRIPEFVPVEQALTDSPSYRRLILGRTEHEVVTADLASLVHMAIGGSSGWGKSIFLRWITYQLVRSTDPVQLALIDLENVTLAPFAQSDRVLWPVADTERDAIAIMRELTGELDRRKSLYKQFETEGVDSLYAYNDVADEPLVPIVTVVDEATALLDDKDVESSLRTLALRARKYGLWLVLAGQDWKASTLDTSIRNHLGARVQFRAMDATQSRVLIGNLDRDGAEKLTVAGRAIAILKGREPVEFQSPLVKPSEIRAVRRGGPVNAMPILDADDGELSDAEKEARVLELHEQGLSNRQIEKKVFGYNGGRATERVRDIIEAATT